MRGDTTFEPDESFIVHILNPSSGQVNSNASQATATILNDDSAAVAGSVAINDVSIAEGNSGTKALTFTATRTGGTAAFDVNYATSDGGATVADGDYLATSGILHFGANDTSKTISVTVNGDTRLESDEALYVDLSHATNGASVGDGRGIGTINNDDSSGIEITYDAGGGYTVHQIDLQGQYDWTDYFTSYDAADRRLSGRILFDDGTSMQSTYDPLNSYNWSAVHTKYDQQDRAVTDNIDYDDGTHMINQRDVAGAYAWTNGYTIYDSTWTAIRDGANFDDGTLLINVRDAYNQYSWTDGYTVYDRQGRPITNGADLDDGTHLVNQQDSAGIYAWKNSYVFFDAAWKETEAGIEFDDGHRVVQLWDLDNQQNWSTATNYYDASNHLIRSTGVYDNGKMWDYA